MSIRHYAALAALMVGACSASWAQPGVSVSYLQQTGTVGPTDSIEVWVRLTADHAFGTELGAPFGFQPTDLPATGYGYDPATGSSHDQAFVQYTSLQIIPGWSCSNACSPTGYTFQNFLGLNAWGSVAGGTLRPGDYKVGSFVPVAGGVAPGTYSFNLVPEVQFNIRGASASGTELSTVIGSPSSACAYNDRPACTFTRTVVSAVPESGTALMGLIGLVGLGVLLRRQRFQG